MLNILDDCILATFCIGVEVTDTELPTWIILLPWTDELLVGKPTGVETAERGVLMCSGKLPPDDSRLETDPTPTDIETPETVLSICGTGVLPLAITGDIGADNLLFFGTGANSISCAIPKQINQQTQWITSQ